MAITHDDSHDVLYVLRTNARPVTSGEAPVDGHLILDYDPTGAVVGARLLFASEGGPEWWPNHPDRGALPADLLAEIDSWFSARPK